MSLPSPQETIAFVVFFFPGFLALSIAHVVSATSIRKRSSLELIVWSSILSIISFSLAGIVLIPEKISEAIFTPQVVVNVFLLSVMLGLITGLAGISWLYVGNAVAVTAQKVASILHISYRSYKETCSSSVLRQIFASGEKSEIVINVGKDIAYRGFLGGYGFNPLEITLIATEGNPIIECKRNECHFIDEYLMIFRDKDIKRISAIGTG
jgi:hypothetical protein